MAEPAPLQAPRGPGWRGPVRVLAALLAFFGGAAVVFPALAWLMPRCAPDAVCDGPGMLGLAAWIFMGPVVGIAAALFAWTRLLAVVPRQGSARHEAIARTLAAVPVLVGVGVLAWLGWGGGT